MEQTLVIFKPDSVQRGIVGQIVTRFENAGYKIVGTKMLNPDYDHYHKHYEGIGTLKTRKGDEIFENTLSGMLEGPVIAMVLEGIDAVDGIRKMVGATEPKQALPGTIRGDFAHVTFAQASTINKGVANIVHASADKDEAKKEIAHWFKSDELYSYKASHEPFTQPR
jgi:nucleoside-diphosphate kinase